MRYYNTRERRPLMPAIVRLTKVGMIFVCSVWACLQNAVAAEASGGDRKDLSIFPLHFEPTQRQSDSEFTTSGDGYELSFRSASVALQLSNPESLNAATVSVAFIGSRQDAWIEPLDREPAVSHYLYGSDAIGWRTGVPHFGRIKVHSIYPGVDLLYSPLKASWNMTYGWNQVRITAR
jgi:hypothetical protein